MLRIAILDPVLPHQISERPNELEGIDVVWKGTSVEEMRTATSRLRPSVLVLDLDTLGDEGPTEVVRELQSSSGAELVITLYRFARRELVEALARDGRKVVKSPISLAGLRSQMLGALVRSIFSDTPATKVEPPSSVVAPRAFTEAQLGRLAEIQSAVDCECPNHVSSVLQSLVGFEDYSARCESRDSADAKVHRALYEHAAMAREIMERAMRILIEHENITL